MEERTPELYEPPSPVEVGDFGEDTLGDDIASVWSALGGRSVVPQ